MRVLFLRLVSTRAGYSLSPECGGIEGWFFEVGGLEAFKEEHLRRSGLQAERTLRGKQASEVGLKRVEQRKGFQRVHMAEIASEGNGVLALLPCDVVHNLCAALLIEIRVAAVHACGKGVEHLQVRLRRDRWKIKRPVAVLQPQFIHEMGRKS